ncbi:tape measure protein [Pseudoalteromonas sp. JBTF-M23]|uniref:Tape measure protein n=1 Tax=Pseudoalteromonas caenipelagi TaxID=2726988 RepID=A0A849VBV5_9GAMM|nr:tape measure protein [Pseudoalteromonas caenipelagi]NOU50270.1 tape measure protein [Pseudoalteromonas caenipelagi]
MSKDLNLALRLKYDGKSVTSGTARNVRDLNQLPVAIRKQVAANERLGASQATLMRQQTSIGHQLGILQSGYSGLVSAMSGVVGIGTAAMFVRDTGNAQLLDTRLKGLTSSAREYNAVQNYLFATADRLNTSYTTLADSYSKILNLQEAGVVTQSQGVQILEGFANAAAKTGAGNEQLKQSLFGMTQGMTAGVLRAEELNQVTEPLPGLMQKLDKASGQAAGGFRQMVNDGKVTSQMFKRYLIKALNEYAGAAEATEGKINASFAEMGNEYQRLIREYEKPVNFAVTSVVSVLKSAMVELRENKGLVEGLTTSATALAIVIGSKLVGSAAQSATVFASQALAKNRALQASLALAAQEQRSAVIQHKAAVQAQQFAQHQLNVARTTELRSRAIAQLAIANQRAVATQATLTAATNNYSVAAARANVVTRTLASGMALLGGPAGIAVTAALGIAYFASQSDEASTSTKELKTYLYDLSDAFDSVNNANARSQFNTAKNKIANYTTNIENAYEKLKRFKTLEQQASSDKSKFHYKQQIAEVERYIQSQSQLRAETMKTAQDIANIGNNLESLPWQKLKEQSKEAVAELPENIKRLQVSLLSEEAALKHSYNKRKQMVETARDNDAANTNKYNAILKQLAAKYSDDLTQLKEKKEAEKTRIQNQAERKRKNDQRAALENRIAQVKGFANREALEAYNSTLQVEQARQQARIDAKRRSQIGLAANDDAGEIKYNTDNEIRDLERQQELLAAQGYQSQREADEAAHQERLMQIRTRHTGPLQAQLLEFANFEKKTALEKTSAVVGLGAAGLKAMGEQSKKAFKMYKAFAISQALIKTYESATSAYSALAWIKPIGPALGAAAAAAAVAMGMAQVRQIKAQQPAGIAHGGLDYVPNESTYLLQRGERVLSPKQNIEISAMARHYNAGERQGTGNISFNITNQIMVQGGADEASSNRVGQDIGKQITALIIKDIQENGVIIKSIRNAA